MRDATNDPWTCAHCGARFPIPSLTVIHEHECDLRPEESK